MPVNPELLTAYHKADYVVFGHRLGAPELVIRIGQRNPGLDELLEHNQAAAAAFVTASNPNGERRSFEENEKATLSLRQSPLVVGHPWFRGEGRDPEGRWPPEPSLLIVGIPRREAEGLGAMLRQNAIVYIEKGSKAELVVLA